MWVKNSPKERSWNSQVEQNKLKFDIVTLYHSDQYAYIHNIHMYVHVVFTNVATKNGILTDPHWVFRLLLIILFIWNLTETVLYAGQLKYTMETDEIFREQDSDGCARRGITKLCLPATATLVSIPLFRSWHKIKCHICPSCCYFYGKADFGKAWQQKKLCHRGD
jgi:hypothetical protein